MLFDSGIDVADPVKIQDDRDYSRVYRDKDGDYVLTGGGYEYGIQRKRINTGPKLV